LKTTKATAAAAGRKWEPWMTMKLRPMMTFDSAKTDRSEGLLYSTVLYLVSFDKLFLRVFAAMPLQNILDQRKGKDMSSATPFFLTDRNNVDYRNVRPDYVKAIWDVINWDTVEARLIAAEK
jgi:hypothetical protein